MNQPNSVSRPSWRALSLRPKALFLFLMIAVAGVAAYLFVGSEDGDSASTKSIAMAATLDGDEVDHLQFGSRSSIEGVLADAFRIRLDGLPLEMKVLDDDEIRPVRFHVAPNGRIALVGVRDESQGLVLVDPKSGKEVELIEYDDVSISATFVQSSSQFFATVAEEDRSRCIGVDLRGNQTLIGRGYCQVLTSGDVLAIDEDDDSDEVTVVKANSTGEQTGRYDFELSEFAVIADGTLAFGYQRDGADERPLLSVFDFREEEVWQQPEDALSAEVVDESQGGILIAVDVGNEEVSIELVKSVDDGAEVTTIASAEEVSVFVANAGETIIVGESMADKEIDEWRVVSDSGVASEDVFFQETLTSWFEVPSLDRVVAFDGSKGEVYSGSIDGGLEFVDDVDADSISVYVSGQDVFVHASDTFYLLDIQSNELFRLSNDVAEVQFVSEDSGVVVFTDDDENSRLARFVDGALVDLDEDDNIFSVLIGGDGFLYYTTSDFDGDNLTLKAIKLQEDRGRQGSEVSKDIADEVLLGSAVTRWNAGVEPSYSRAFEAIIDERRRACRDEGLEILEVSGTTTLQSIPGQGSVICLTVTESDVAGNPYFGVEVSNDADFDLAMTIEMDGDTLYEADDQMEGGKIVSYSPVRDDMFLEVGTYRLKVFPVEGGGVSAPTAIRFFTTTTTSSEYSEVTGSESFSTSGCDYILESSDYSVVVEVTYDFTNVLCIERLATDTILLFEIGTVYDGSYLDVNYDCDDFGGDFYLGKYSELQLAGKGYNRCSITETWPSDGSNGELIVSYGGE